MSVHREALTWEVSREAPMVRYVFRGELDQWSADRFEAAVREAGADDIVVLDLGGVDFIDSAGLRALLRAHAAVERRGGRLFVGTVSPPVGRALAVTGLDRYVEGAIPTGHMTRRSGPRRRPWR